MPKYFLFGVIILIILIGVVLHFRTVNLNSDPMEKKFTGIITRISFACELDGSCDLIIDNDKYVHFGHDTRGQVQTEWGNSDSLWAVWNEGKSVEGKKVEVYAADDGANGYTIQGKKEYYIKVLN